MTETEFAAIPVTRRDAALFAVIIAIVAVGSYFGLSALRVPEDHPIYLEFTHLMLSKYGIHADLNGFDQLFWQTVATTIFAATVVGTLMFWRFRLAIALIGVFLIVLTRTAPIHLLLEFMGLDVIVFLMGMFVLVEFLRRAGFFRFFIVKSFRISGYRTIPLIAVVLATATLLASMVDEVTSILFVTSAVLDLSTLLGVNPFPLILLAVCTTNLGSAATVLGNPIGIYVATRSGLGFLDFITHSAPIVVVSLALTITLGILVYRRHTRLIGEGISLHRRELSALDPWSRVRDMKMFYTAIAVFLATIALISSHAFVEGALGLEHNSILISAPWLGAGIIMLVKREEARDYVEKGVDWWTLTFFLFLFAKAAALEFTGVTYKLAYLVEKLAAGNGPLTPMTTTIAFTIILWLSGTLTGFIDNMPLIAALLPVTKALVGLGMPAGEMLWWALIIGGTFGGNLTMVGSTANIVALGILEREKDIHVRLSHWIKAGAIITLSTLGLATVIYAVWILSMAT